MIRRVLVILLCVLASRTAQAQPAPATADQTRYVDPVSGISVDEAVAQALGNEPGLRAARTAIDAARGRQTQAGLRPNPAVTAGHQREPGGTDSQTRLELQWPLDLFRRPGRLNVAQRETEAAALMAGDRERQLAADVRVMYGTIAAIARNLDITDEATAAVRRQHQLIAARVQEGAAPPLERDQLAVELRRLEAGRLLLSGQADAAIIELKRLLGMPAASSLRLRDSLEQLVQRDLAIEPAVDATAIERRPDVREATTRVLLADALIDRAQREGRFDANVFGMYMRMDAGFPQRGFTDGDVLQRVRGRFNYLAGGVMVTLPVRDRRQGEIAAARAERIAAEARRDAARLTAQSELEGARLRHASAERALNLWSGDARVLARQNLDVVVQTYELGRLALTEVLNERRRYLDFERSFTDTLREAYEAAQAVRRAAGDGQ